MKNILFLLAFPILFSFSHAADEVRKSNDVLNIPLGAKVLASGGALLGATPNVERILFHPALAVEGETSVSINHINYFADSDLNSLSGLYKVDDSNSAFFLSIARFGADDIPLTFEDSLGRPVDKNGNTIQGNPETFSIQDIWLTSGYGLEIFKMNVGVNFNVLYRDLGDQWAMGLRSDASLAKQIDNFRVDVLLKSWSTSALFSEEGNLEYEPTDIYLGAGYLLDVPYFYGVVNFAWQSAAFIHKGNRSREDISGERIWDNPGMWIGDSKLGIEYESKWGLGLSLGWAFIREWKYPAWGFNFALKQVEVAYGWEAHPELGSIHSFGVNYSFGSGTKEKVDFVNPIPVIEEDKIEVQENLAEEVPGSATTEPITQNDTTLVEEILFEEELAEETLDSANSSEQKEVLKKDSIKNETDSIISSVIIVEDSVANSIADTNFNTLNADPLKIIDSSNVNNVVVSDSSSKEPLENEVSIPVLLDSVIVESDSTVLKGEELIEATVQIDSVQNSAIKEVQSSPKDVSIIEEEALPPEELILP